jgi:hypothetical protein
VRLRAALLSVALLVALVAAAPGSAQQLREPGWRNCEPPQDSFIYRLRANDVSCETARRVVTRGRCIDNRCGRTRFGPWRCRIGSSIVDRAIVCQRGERQIIARASGD